MPRILVRTISNHEMWLESTAAIGILRHEDWMIFDISISLEKWFEKKTWCNLIFAGVNSRRFDLGLSLNNFLFAEVLTSVQPDYLGNEDSNVEAVMTWNTGTGKQFHTSNCATHINHIFVETSTAALWTTFLSLKYISRMELTSRLTSSNQEITRHNLDRHQSMVIKVIITTVWW